MLDGGDGAKTKKDMKLCLLHTENDCIPLSSGVMLIS